MNTEQIVKKINELLTKGTTQSKIAKEIGKSESVISKYLKGVYDGDVVSLENCLKEYILKNEMIKTDIEFIKTKDATCILGICNSCQKLEQLGLVYGRSGFGKTITLKRYSEDTEKDIYCVQFFYEFERHY